MGMFFREAGWGIWPVFFFGVFGVVVALRNAVSPTRERFALIVGLAIATTLMGILGAVTGVQASASGYVDFDPPMRLFVVGVRESLNNLVAALLFATLHTLIGTYGSRKLVRAETGAPSPIA